MESLATRISNSKVSLSDVLVIAGEASSDDHAAGLVRELKTFFPNCSFFGMGGSALRSLGVETIIDSEKHASVMGFVEVLGSIKNLFKVFYEILSEVDKRKPQLAILVDFPDFNLRMAKKLKQRGIKVVYFISPQVWAWRTGRVFQIKRDVSKVLTIFKFEEDFYSKYGVNAEFVGHPFSDRKQISKSKDELRREFGVSLDKKLIALLPGSRNAEIERLLPVMKESIDLLKKHDKNLEFILPVAHTLSISKVKELLSSSSVRLIEGQAREVLACADVGVICSGTANVEAALAGLPFVVVYRLNHLSYIIGKLLIKGVKFISMVNIIGKKKVVTELVQSDCTAENLSKEVIKILDDHKYREGMLEELKNVKEGFFGGMDKEQLSVSKRAAQAVVNMLEENQI